MLDGVGHDDRLTQVAETRVHGECQGVHFGRLAISGDHDRRAAMAFEVCQGRIEPLLCFFAEVARGVRFDAQTAGDCGCDFSDFRRSCTKTMLGHRAGV